MSLEEGSSTHKRESPRLIEPHSISELAATLEDIFAKRASETDVKESRHLQARIKRLHSVMEVLPEKTAELGAAIEKVTKESACGPVAIWLVGGWSKNKPFKSSSDFDLIVT